MFEYISGPFKIGILIFLGILIYLLIRNFLKIILVKKVKTKKMKHNITMFLNIMTYTFILIGILMTSLYFIGDTVSIGLTAGLLSAALGWALQRPITGIAAWIMVVIAKPFSIGDRIIIGDKKGDVENITLSHIYLKEFGGTTGGEETSGRTVMIPNSLLFEKDIINYTFQDDFILDEVILTVTYESDLKKAKKICLDSVEKITKDYQSKIPSTPYLRIGYQPSGIDIRIRYYAPSTKRQLFNSQITEETFERICADKGVEIAYPHTEVVFRKK